MIGTLINEATSDELSLLDEFSLGVLLNILPKNVDLVMSQVFEARMRTQILSQSDALTISSGTQRVIFVISHH